MFRPRRLAIWASVALLVVVAGHSAAQDATDAEARAAESRYIGLITRALADPKTVNFAELRLAYTRTQGYDPYADHSALDTALMTAIEGGRWHDALRLVESGLAGAFVRTRFHGAAAFVHEMLGHITKAQIHRAIELSLLKSILDSGDGMSPTTAFVVIDTEEEYILLEVLGLDHHTQFLVSEDGRDFDVFEVSLEPGAPMFEIYFDISVALRFMQRQLRG